MLLSSTQLQETLIAAGIRTPIAMMADKDYVTPTRKWLLGDYCQFLGAFLHQVKAAVWTGEENDCDDFARMGASLAQLLHHRTRTREKRANTALAVGEFWYHKAGEGGHAILAALVEDGALLFIEPQGPAEIRLTPKEIKSCFAYHF